TDIMYDTGFDPHAMSQFFQKLEAQGGSRGPQFLSDHPNPGNRAQLVSHEVSTLALKQFRGDSAEFRAVKQRVSGMKPLTAQQIAAQQQSGATSNSSSSGISASDISPSGKMRSFSHSTYSISYPDNWQVFGDQNSAVTIAPQSGVSKNAVAYGAMINDYQPENQNATVDQATHDLLASLRQSNPDLRQIGHDENIRVGGVA